MKIINKKDFLSMLKSVNEKTGNSKNLPQKRYRGYSVQFYISAGCLKMNVYSFDSCEIVGSFEFGKISDYTYETFLDSATGEFEEVINHCGAESEIRESHDTESVVDIANSVNLPENTELVSGVVEKIEYSNRKEQAEAFTEAIRKEFSIAGSAQLATALLIKTVYEKKLYDVYGYDNLYDYTAMEFNIARGTTSNWLMLATNFGVYDAVKDMYTLDSRLDGYTITQLVLLRSLKIEQIQSLGFTPDLTCKQIKDKLSVLNLHITKGAKVPIEKNSEKSKILEEPDESEEQEYKELYLDCEDNTSAGQRARLSFTVKGGTTIMDSQLAVLQDMVRKQSDKIFEIKVFVK